MQHGGNVMGVGGDRWWSRPGPMLMPIRMMIPGPPIESGTWQIMGNASLVLTHPGFADANDPALGRFHPYALNDWIMGRARTGDGYFEGLLMLNFEPLTLRRAGWVEVGQAGEGLIDAQHQHQLLHQALIAIHLTGASRGPLRASLWGGQGSASIGPPIFMHRASNPSPTVPRKHHKGENPHETFPVIGVTLEAGSTALDVSVFNAREPTRDQSRLLPRPGAPTSYAARIRQTIAETTELQLSAERLFDQGDEEDATQVSASIYHRYVGRFVLDALLDGAADIPARHDVGGHGTATAGLLEIAVRDASLRHVAWSRLEVNDRVEADERVSRRWFFGSLGYEWMAWTDPGSVVGVGPFGEATLVRVPDSVSATYGDRTGVTTMIGLQAHLMWMPGVHGQGSHHGPTGGGVH
jgi:hypothetical protein